MITTLMKQCFTLNLRREKLQVNAIKIHVLQIIIIFTESDSQLCTTQAFVQELNTMVTSHKEQVKTYLKHINALLTNAILKCKAAIAETSTKPTAILEPFSNKQNMLRVQTQNVSGDVLITLENKVT